MVPHLFPPKLCPGSPGHGRCSRPKEISMEGERRDEFGGVKKSPLRNSWKPSSTATHAPFFPFTSRGWRRAGAFRSTLVKPKIKEFRHGSTLTLKINKRFKTSFTGTRHRKRFYILVSKDKEGRRWGRVRTQSLDPELPMIFDHMSVSRMSGERIGHPLLWPRKENLKYTCLLCFPPPKQCLLSVNLLWIRLAHLWYLC